METKIKLALQDKVTAFINKMETVTKLLNLYSDDYYEEKSAEEIESWKSTIGYVIKRTKLLAEDLAQELPLSFLFNDRDNVMLKGRLLNDKYLKLKANFRYIDSCLEDLLAFIDEHISSFYRNMNDEDYDRMYDAEWSRYVSESTEMTIRIWEQDYKDLYSVCDDDERKRRLYDNCLNKLLDDKPYGVAYHDCAKDKTEIARIIFANREKDYTRINRFFNKLLSLEFAKKKLEESNSDNDEYVNNLIFHESLQARKIFDKLMEFINNGTLEAQRHWFVAYLVFKEKKWLTKDSQSKFRDQVNAVFRDKLICTQSDFKKVKKYYKDCKFRQWNAADPLAPESCDKYIEIADMLDREFVDNKYLIPGKLIKRRK